MKKRTLWIWLWFFLGLVGTIYLVGKFYLYPRILIINSYVAKNVCSCVFSAQRTNPEQDLNFFPINWAHYEIDPKDSTVSSRVLGLGQRKAIYRKGYGCSILIESEAEQVRAQTFPREVLFAQADTSQYWPRGEKIQDSLPENLEIDDLREAVDQAFDQRGEAIIENTRAVVVIYQGQLIAEQYAEGFDQNTPLTGWSATKSIVNALLGILVKEGKIDLKKPAPIAAWQEDLRRKITWENLLQMTSGLAWEEYYSSPSDATELLFNQESAYDYAIQSAAKFPADSVWYYSSGTTNILSGLIRQVLNNDTTYQHFPYQALFQKIGMRSAVMEMDASGNFVGSSFSFATARDWARLGLLYLQDGVWEGERILPKGWVTYSTSSSRAAKGRYGAHIWLNQSQKLQDVPSDMYSFNGFQGQRVYVIPSRDLVVVRLGLSTFGGFDFNLFLKRIVEVIDQAE